MTPGRKRGLWVSKRDKGGVEKLLRGIQEGVEVNKGRCLFVIDEKGRKCGEPVFEKRHVIPRSSVLNKLKDDASGNVIEFRWGVSKWRDYFLRSSEANPINLNDPDSFEPQCVGSRDACVGWFACKRHDSKFDLVDDAAADFSDPTVRFLAVYRAALYAADLSRQGARLHQDWDKKIMRGPYPHLRSLWVENRNIIKTGTPKARSTAARLGKIWHTWDTHGEFDPSTVSGQLLCFRSRLKFAACVFYGTGTVVYVFPGEEDWHKMAVLHLAEEAESVKDDSERLIQLSRALEEWAEYGVEVIDELVSNGSGTVAASPESYRGLAVGDRRTIHRLVASSIDTESLARGLGQPPSQPRPAADALG